MKIKKARWLIPILITAGFIVFACSSGEAAGNEDEKIIVEKTGSSAAAALPSFSLKDSGGNTVNLQDFQGKKVFINLWASWCPPCRAEMPSIAALHKKVDPEKVVFILLSLDENPNASLQFVKRSNINMPVYFPLENLPSLFNTRGIPATFIFNEEGRLVRQQTGAENYDTQEYLRMLSF